MKIKECLYCGEMFEGRGKYCSVRCKHMWNVPYITVAHLRKAAEQLPECKEVWLGQDGFTAHRP